MQEGYLLPVIIEMQLLGIQCELGRFEAVKKEIEKTLKRIVSRRVNNAACFLFPHRC